MYFFSRVISAMIFVFLIFTSIGVVANFITGMPFLKYGYGLIDWGSEAKSIRPEIYDLNKSWEYELALTNRTESKVSGFFSYYNIPDAKNKIEHGVDVNLDIKQVNSNVIATVSFNNKSGNDYYIYRNNLNTSNEDITFGVLCSSSFLITTENIRLDYIGRYCDLDIDDIVNGWKKIEAGRIFSFTVTLNRAYEFLPGKHQYRIGSLDYLLITPRGVYEYAIYDLMFSILSGHCSYENEALLPMMTKNCWFSIQCKSNDGYLKILLANVGIDGKSADNYFKIRTNQVSVSINADDETSYYQFMKNILNR